MQQYLPLAVLKPKIKQRSQFILGSLQQYLPLAVLKLIYRQCLLQQQFIATVLTACGIETYYIMKTSMIEAHIATVLTACGIETKATLALARTGLNCNSTYRLRY